VPRRPGQEQPHQRPYSPDATDREKLDAGHAGQAELHGIVMDVIEEGFEFPDFVDGMFPESLLPDIPLAVLLAG
jgi:hypothetical protein